MIGWLVGPPSPLASRLVRDSVGMTGGVAGERGRLVGPTLFRPVGTRRRKPHDQILCSQEAVLFSWRTRDDVGTHEEIPSSQEVVLFVGSIAC